MENEKNRIIDIYTDGGCSGNPGPGGWAYVILDGEDALRGSGSEKHTTNNRMELTAVIEALKAFKSDKRFRIEGGPCNCCGGGVAETRIFTDSAYVKNGITLWIEKWVKNGWKTADKKDVKNRELWVELKELSDCLHPRRNWVKGHAGNRWNEECDSLVRKEIDNICMN